jgi:hypothetical protein
VRARDTSRHERRAGEQRLAAEKASWDRLAGAVRLIFNEGA